MLPPGNPPPPPPPTNALQATALATREYAEVELDKQLIALAGGALVLTVGFVKDIVSIATATNIIFLFWSWISFALCLALVLASHLTSLSAADARLKSINYNAAGNTTKANAAEKRCGIWTIVTHVVNRTSVFVLIAGFVFFIVFVVRNLGDTKKSASVKTEVKKEQTANTVTCPCSMTVVNNYNKYPYPKKKQAHGRTKKSIRKNSRKKAFVSPC